MFSFLLGYGKGVSMKKYLLLIEDEKVWKKFKEVINRDLNTEIMNLIKKKIGVEVKDE